MAVSFVNKTEVADDTGNTPFTLNVPAGVLDNDILIAILTMDSNTNDWVRPGGWTALQNDIHTAGQTTDVSYRVAASEPASYNWTHDVGASATTALMVAYRGGVTSPVLETSSVGQQTGTALTFPSITTTTDQAMVIVYVTSDNTGADGAQTYSIPAGYTSRANFQSTTARISTMLAEKVKTPAGTESGNTTNYGVNEPTVDIAYGVVAIAPLVGAAGIPVAWWGAAG